MTTSDKINLGRLISDYREATRNMDRKDKRAFSNALIIAMMRELGLKEIHVRQPIDHKEEQ
jgi:hypothetical protein